MDMDIDFAYSIFGLLRNTSISQVSEALQQKLWSIPVQLSQIEKNILKQYYKEAFTVITKQLHEKNVQQNNAMDILAANNTLLPIRVTDIEPILLRPFERSQQLFNSVPRHKQNSFSATYSRTLLVMPNFDNPSCKAFIAIGFCTGCTGEMHRIKLLQAPIFFVQHLTMKSAVVS